MGSMESRDPQRAAQGEAMNRLDEIERRFLHAQGTDTVFWEGAVCRDVLALVAVARAAAKRCQIRRKMAEATGADWERLHLHDAADAELDLEAALAPLLQETSADAGEGR